MTAPRAGWYPDPDRGGGQRYFDGQVWTEHRVDPPAPPPRPAPLPPTPETLRRQRVNRRWALGLAVALVLGFGGAVFALSRSSTSRLTPANAISDCQMIVASTLGDRVVGDPNASATHSGNSWRVDGRSLGRAYSCTINELPNGKVTVGGVTVQGT